MTLQPNDEIYAFSVTFPAGTLQSAPITVNTRIPSREINGIDIVVPPGPSGLMGFQIGMAGVPIIPRNAGGYIVTDDEKISWPLRGLANTGAWQVIGYNTDIFDHTIQVKYLVSLVITAPSGQVAGGQAVNSISAAAGADTAAAQVAMLSAAPPTSSAADAHGLAAAAARPGSIAVSTIHAARDAGEISADLAAQLIATRSERGR